MRTVVAAFAEAEACALAHVIRSLNPVDFGVDPIAWYGALDKLSPQLPDSMEEGAPTAFAVPLVS